MDEQNKPAEDLTQPAATPVTLETPGQVTTTPMPPGKKSSKKVLLVVLAIVLLAGAGAAAWYLTKDDDTNTTTTQTNQSDQQTPTPESEEIEMKTTTFTSGLADKSTVSFEHPATWEAKTSSTPIEGSPGETKNLLIIGSPAGHYMYLDDKDGIGGGCDGEEASTYTLTKKLPTKTPDLYLTQYKINNGFFAREGFLSAERFNTENSIAAHEALKEGESSTDSCRVVLNYRLILSTTRKKLSALQRLDSTAV